MKTESVLNHSIISQRYFFPRFEPFSDPYIIECNGNNLACYYQNSFPDSKTIIFFHGNGEVVADYLDFFPEIFENEKYNLLLFEFRGYGMSDGSPVLVDMLSDVECVLKQLDIEQCDLIFYGRSVGTIYAVHAASVFTDAYALILESGIADVEERILMRINDPSEIDATSDEWKADFKKYFNTQSKLEAFKGKSLVIHTLNDQLVSVDNGKRLFEYLNEPKKLHIFERGDHNTVFYANRDLYFSLIFEFLKD